MTLKNDRLDLTNSWVTVYTVPSAKTARVIHCQVCGKRDPSAPLSLRWRDSSASNATVDLVEEMPIPDHAAVAPIDGELVLETGDSLQAKSDGSNRLTLSLSVDETS